MHVRSAKAGQIEREAGSEVSRCLHSEVSSSPPRTPERLFWDRRRWGTSRTPDRSPRRGQEVLTNVSSYEHDDQNDDCNDYGDDGEHACVQGCLLTNRASKRDCIGHGVIRVVRRPVETPWPTADRLTAPWDSVSESNRTTAFPQRKMAPAPWAGAIHRARY